MASIILAAAGTAIGGSIGGTVLGVSAATIGGAVGSIAGAAIDSWLVASMAPTQKIAGQRLDTLQITASTEGAVIPRVYGRMRTGGNIIWATDFREETETTRHGGGGKGGGGGGGTEVTEYFYFASLAVALCEGLITGVGRVWADGKPMNLDGVTMRVHLGDEDQDADPFIAAKMGVANTPAYRGTAYVVFEELPLERFGNRMPQLSFEVFRPILDGESAESLVRAVTLIPASGEFAYATDIVRREGGEGETSAENVNAEADRADLVVALDRLEACAPKVESVSLVVAWFGDDLRAGDCRIRPGVEVSAKATTPEHWSVNGVSRGSAHLVSRDAQNRPAYGGTPSDGAIVQAIRELKARGYRVTFYPFILMDVPADNDLPDPYSDNAAAIGQPAYPWRGRITCSPAAGYAASPDKTAAAGTQIAAFFGDAQPSDFDVDDEQVAWDGDPDDWGLRRMILHYAHLCAAAGGVDAFLIGSELRGITQARSGASTYPAVAELVDLAADVRSILGSGTAISYAADWSEYFGHHARHQHHPSPAPVSAREPGAEARHPQRGAAAARRASAARRARSRSDGAAGQSRRRRPSHRRLVRDRRLGRLGRKRRLLGRRRLDAPRPAARLESVGRRRGDARDLDGCRMGAHRCRTRSDRARGHDPGRRGPDRQRDRSGRRRGVALWACAPRQPKRCCGAPAGWKGRCGAARGGLGQCQRLRPRVEAGHRAIRSEGHTTLRAIAAELDARGMLTRRGGHWHVSNVRNLLAKLDLQTEK